MPTLILSPRYSDDSIKLKCVRRWHGELVRVMKQYHYVGPEPIRLKARGMPGGRPIVSLDELASWLKENQGAAVHNGLIAATFVIDPDGALRLTDRRSEHVACASGGPVLSAGELFLSAVAGVVVVQDVSNLSTGYCPEPESWGTVGNALDRIGAVHPGRFTIEVIFRRCPKCGERNVVKDGWFACLVCGGELPAIWNFTGPPISKGAAFQ